MSIVIQLDYPITLGTGELLDSLSVRRAKVKDIRRMNEKKSDDDKEIALLTALTGLVPEDLDELDISDYTKLQEVLKEMAVGKQKA